MSFRPPARRQQQTLLVNKLFHSFAAIRLHNDHVPKLFSGNVQRLQQTNDKIKGNLPEKSSGDDPHCYNKHPVLLPDFRAGRDARDAVSEDAEMT